MEYGLLEQSDFDIRLFFYAWIRFNLKQMQQLNCRTACHLILLCAYCKC